MLRQYFYSFAEWQVRSLHGLPSSFLLWPVRGLFLITHGPLLLNASPTALSFLAKSVTHIRVAFQVSSRLQKLHMHLCKILYHATTASTFAALITARGSNYFSRRQMPQMILWCWHIMPLLAAIDIHAATKMGRLSMQCLLSSLITTIRYYIIDSLSFSRLECLNMPFSILFYRVALFWMILDISVLL